MESLYPLIPVSLLIVFAIGGVFWWALNNRQFDKLDDAAGSILNDIDAPADAAHVPIQKTASSHSTTLLPAQQD